MAQERQSFNCKLRPETVKKILELEKSHTSRADFFDALLAAFTGDHSPQDKRIAELEKELKEKTHEAGSLGIDLKQANDQISDLEIALEQAQANQDSTPPDGLYITLNEKEAAFLEKLAGNEDIKEWLIYKLICQVFKFHPRPVQITSPEENYKAYLEFIAP